MGSTAEYAGILLIIPFIEQVFFTGIIFQSLLKKINPILAIYAAGIIYSLAGFKLSLGAFGLGVVTSFLFKSTKTLYASIIFHASCAVGGSYYQKRLSEGKHSSWFLILVFLIPLFVKNNFFNSNFSFLFLETSSPV